MTCLDLLKVVIRYTSSDHEWETVNVGTPAVRCKKCGFLVKKHHSLRYSFTEDNRISAWGLGVRSGHDVRQVFSVNKAPSDCVTNQEEK
jgi:hypothetical protein